MELGERIRRLRKLHGMTIEALASKVGVTRQTISRYETGAIEDIPKSRLEGIAAALDVSCDYLRGWTVESQRDSALFDIQQLKEDLQSAKSAEERAGIEQSIAILEESYDDLCFASLQASPQPQFVLSASDHEQSSRFTIGNRVREWKSDKKANLTMSIDSWLLFALKGIAADSKRSLSEEIEEALYDYVMNAIEEETSKHNAIY